MQINLIHWDAHGCPPFKIGSDLSFLKRYKKAGVDFISLNIGFDLSTKNEVINRIKYFNNWINDHKNDFLIVKNVSQIIDAKSENKLSIAFDLEGSNMLDEDINAIETFYRLGVRQFSPVYNKNNKAGGGCLEHDEGLTAYGTQLVKKCNEVGMVIDCSHVGYRTSLEIMESSSAPVVFSHSNPKKLCQHPRNISDEQITACANQDGVIGITGVGIFLGNNDIRTEKIVEHIDYITQKVGSRHVGIGLDCIFSWEEIDDMVNNNPTVFPESQNFNDVVVAEPEQFSEISQLLIKKGYAKSDIDNILGGNFYRVASTVWK